MVLGVLLGKVISVLLVRRWHEVGWGPQVRSQETVGLGQGVVHSHCQVTSGTGVTSGGRVDVFNTSHVQQLLWDQRGDDTRTTRSWDQSAADGTALARDLAWDSVWGTGVQTPVTSADWNQVHLGVDDTTTDGSSDFLGSLNTKTDVASSVTDSDVALEAGALTSGGLLLDRHDLHDFVSQSWAKKGINDLVFLDWHGEKEDFLDGLDLAILDQAAKLGDWGPSTFFLLVATTTTTATATATFTVTATSKLEGKIKNRINIYYFSSK